MRITFHPDRDVTRAQLTAGLGAAAGGMRDVRSAFGGVQVDSAVALAYLSSTQASTQLAEPVPNPAPPVDPPRPTTSITTARPAARRRAVTKEQPR